VRIAITLATGLLLIAIATGVTLAHAPLVVARENISLTHKTLVTTDTAASACQTHEALPRGTSAIRLGLTADVGPRVAVQVLAGARVLTRGARAAGWAGASVTVPVKPVSRADAPVEICFQMSLLNGPVEMLGSPSAHGLAARADGKTLPGRMHVEYLRPGHRSWWSMATAVAWRLDLGRAASGTWYALIVIALAATVAALTSWLVLRELR
jgi:hypothetical protein